MPQQIWRQKLFDVTVCSFTKHDRKARRRTWNGPFQGKRYISYLFIYIVYTWQLTIYTQQVKVALPMYSVHAQHDHYILFPQTPAYKIYLVFSYNSMPLYAFIVHETTCLRIKDHLRSWPAWRKARFREINSTSQF